MNVTFDFLEREWADKVDFVICESLRQAGRRDRPASSALLWWLPSQG